MYKNILLISDCPVSCYLGGDIDIDIYLTAIGLAPGGGIIRHIYNQTIPNLHREKNFEPRENKKQQTAGTCSLSDNATVAVTGVLLLYFSSACV